MSAGGAASGPGEEPTLGGEAQVLVALGAALAARENDAFRAVLEEAARKARPEAVEEALVQSYLFLGYPVALGGLAAWREVSGTRAPPPAEEDPAAWATRGEEVCRIVYGDQYEALRRNVRGLHPDMERWMLEEGYGKVLGRRGLSLRVRELCIAAILAVLDTPVQLYSHLRGALNAGASPGEVEAALAVAFGFMDDGARRSAEATWNRVLRRFRKSGQARHEGE